MRTKRTILSMIIFLSVLCLASIIESSITSNGLLATHSNESQTTEAISEASLPPQSATDEVKRTAISAYSGDIADSETYDDTQLSDSKPLSLESTNEAISTTTDELLELSKENYLAKASSLVDTNGSSSTETAVTETSEEEATIQEQPVKEKALYSKIGISIAQSYVNIREEANPDSGILGKLYKDSAAEILDTIGDWYYVESGSVKGYVSSEFLKTGISDKKLIDTYGKLNASVEVDGLNVRKEPEIDAEKLTVIYMREKYTIIDLQDDWVKVDIADENITGYVAKEFVNINVLFNDAVSKEEEQKLLRLQEEARIAAQTSVKYGDEVNSTDDEVKLLACLIHSEAGGQSYEGKLAVANVVLNRVKSSKYPDSIKSVIYQSGQFSVAASGSLAKQLSNYSNYSSESQRLSIKAAKAALDGANNIGSRLYFHSYKAAVKKGYDQRSSSVKIQDHLFW